MRPGQGLMPLYLRKYGKDDSENDRGGMGNWGRRIVLMQIKVGNLGNLGRMTRYIHKEPLVKSGRVQNLGGCHVREG